MDKFKRQLQENSINPEYNKTQNNITLIISNLTSAN